MRKSKILAKVRAGRFARVCAMGHYLPFFIRRAAHLQYDGIWLDLEHRAMDPREVQAVLALCHYNDIDCMVRTPTLDRTPLYRYLEDGASGLMIPLLHDVQSAEQVVQAVKFPPLGNRGMDGAGLDSDYGLEPWQPGSTFWEDANRETFVLVQVETLGVVNNLEQIAALDGLEGLFVGPQDLGRRLAQSSKKMAVLDVVKMVAEVAKDYGKVWGITAGSLEDLERYRKMGAQLVPWGGDFNLVQVLEKCSHELDQTIGQE